MSLAKIVGENIKQRRKELGLSLMDLAIKTDLNKSSIYRYENGDFENLNLTTLNTIAEALYTNVNRLMGDANLRSDEQLLLDLYNAFNQQGQKEIFAHLDLLSYKFNGNVLAAHRKTNATKEEIEADIDIIT